MAITQNDSILNDDTKLKDLNVKDEKQIVLHQKKADLHMIPSLGIIVNKD